MAFFKWFGKIDAARRNDDVQPRAPLEPFDYESLRPRGFGKRLKARVTGFVFTAVLPPILRLIQNIHPNLHLRRLNFVIVTRDAYVRQVLTDTETFGVPYGPEMNMLGGGTTFLLGQDGAEHDRLNQIIRSVIRPETDMASFIDMTRRFSEGLIENGCGRIDVVGDLITRVATETGARFCGIDVDDPRTFAQWSFAVSGLLFGDPGGDKQTRALAVNGARRLCLAIDRSIQRSREQGEHRGDSMLDRLIARGDVSDEDMRATLLGTITGFIPTNSLAASKMLAELLKRPDILAEARACAARGDRARVQAIIMEAGRLNSALAPGLWRYARNDAVIAPGTPHARAVPAGTVVLASTMTALRDKRRFASPNQFRTDRGVEGDLMFGAGPHACLGKHMAIEQVTEIFMVLLALPDVRPAAGKRGRMDAIGAFPVRLDMVYRTPSSEQNMVLVIATVTSGASKVDVDAVIATLQHPASPAMRDALDSTGVIHFSSLATVASADGVQIMMELSIDGLVEPAITAIAQAAEFGLRPIFAHAGLRREDDLAHFMNGHVVRLHSRPWGATGLNFNGVGEFSVSQIERQANLATLAESIVQEHLARNANDGSRAMRMLDHVRAVLNQDQFLKNSADPDRDQLDARMLGAMSEAKAAGFDALIMKPSRKKLALAAFQQPGMAEAFFRFLGSGHGTIIVFPVVALFALMLAGVWALVTPPSLFVGPCSVTWRLPPQINGCHIGWPETALALFAGAQAILGALLASVLAIVAFVGAMLALLRYKEAHDPVDTTQASLDHMRAITRIEDHPGCAQNHIMAVGILKGGPFRRLVHAFSLWGIKMVLAFYFRSGFIINMGTIHYARWLRLPGTDRTVFYSNYDGSWASYLEDFITRANTGQTAVWSNWKGFPPSRFLIGRGAKDGDQFKRWVRKHQEIVPFWYSRFPKLTTDQIRNNAMIHHGLARARTDNEARDWLRFFGSMPRVHNRIESDEVQTLVFSGLGKYQHSSYLLVKLPVDADMRRDWLKLIVGQRIDVPLGQDAHLQNVRGIIDPCTNRSAVSNMPFGGGERFWLDTNFTIGFGDRHKQRSQHSQRHLARTAQIFFALTAHGIERPTKIKSKDDKANRDIEIPFPPAFQMGMANRARILGDTENGDPLNWYWGDWAFETPRSSQTSFIEPHLTEPTEAAFLIYGETPEGVASTTSVHIGLLQNFGDHVIDQIDSKEAKRGFGFEHFGFRDGISQPAIRGTSSVKSTTPPRDVMEPGEFILGYENSASYFSPSPTICADSDPSENLPLVPSNDFNRFPDFGGTDPSALPRDFGRNGTFLVMRELSQNVSAFEQHLEQLEWAAFERRDADRQEGVQLAGGGFDNVEDLLGQPASLDWIAAKMMGRWRDGRPFVGNMIEHVSDEAWKKGERPTSAQLANDFSYGTDDPQGLACPFGAHIRRANPRDSKQPGDPIEQTITNRHRLLRRGRTYARPAPEGSSEEGEKGVMFVCLCADIERQFEFVQQTWLNSPSFHGLNNEPDPIMGQRTPETSFTVPTTAGPIKLKGEDGAIEQFVTVRGGGYFFLPSRSALLFLASL